MTMKHEEVNTQKQVKAFLEGLAFGEIKGVDADVRRVAKALLRHLASAETVERGSRL